MHIKLTEYQTKILYKLFTGHSSRFCQITNKTDFNTFINKNKWVLNKKLVCKPDQFVKRRGKNGLIAINVDWETVKQKFKNGDLKVITLLF